MPNDRKDRSVSPEALRRNHESQNPRLRWLLISAGIVVLLITGSFVVTRFAMDVFTKSRPLGEMVRTRGTIVAPNEQVLQRFSGPALQTDPQEDRMALQAREENELNTYGWVDRGAGIVRIPIARAMALLLERGLPTRPTNAPPATGKSSYELIEERSPAR